VPSVAFLTTDWSPNSNPLQPGGSGWYRSFLPMVEMNDRGWQAAMGKPVWEAGRGFGLHQMDGTSIVGWNVVVLKLLMDRQTPDCVLAARELGQKVIIDVDDFHDGVHQDNQSHAQIDPIKSPDMNIDHYNRAIACADVVTVSTTFLFDYYSERHPCVRVVRNGIDFGRYSRVRDQAGWRPTIGWVGGIPWRSGDLETLRDWLPQFIDEHQLNVHHGGHLEDAVEPFWMKAGIPESRVSTAPMKLILDYPSLFTGFQIGVVPLNDIDFNRAKSTIKGLEYAASGIPFVAAASPEYVRLAELGIGRVAATPDEWVKHMTDLMDPGVRKREAASQRALVSKHFSMRERGVEWAQALDETLKSSTLRSSSFASEQPSDRTGPKGTPAAASGGEVTYNIYIPPYQEPLAHMYGGVRALRQLEKELSLRGCRTTVNSFDSGSLSIYPEIVADNPFQAEKRIRWLLNDAQFDDEICFAWTTDMGDHPLLTVNIIEMNLWKRSKSRGNKVAYWVGKGVADPSLIPPGAIEINRTNFPVRHDLAKFISELDYLISFDSFSSITLEARIAGTPVLMHIPDKQIVPSQLAYVDQRWSREKLEKQGWGTYGIAWSVEELELARETVHLQREHYSKMIKVFDRRVDEFIEQSQDLFA
jgi:glycosyltransferase involved in cell wall biosynthesis